jgi:hypothetical protein
MKKSTFLVSSGYAVSIISVILMGIVAWQAASNRDWLTLALVGGIVTSVIGMALRWEAHRLQAEEIENNNKGKDQ